MKFESVAPLDIIYDRRCGFCVRVLRVLQRFDTRRAFQLFDGNDEKAIVTRFPMLAGADIKDAMFTIARDGKVFRGFFAFRRMMWASPWLYPLLAIFYFPGVSVLGPRLYAWVARHRRDFGCTASCEPPGDGSSDPLGS